MKKIKYLILSVLLIPIVLSSTACIFYQYTGAYKDLYTVAINNLFGAYGYCSSEVPFPPVIDVIERDEYGRTLFFYDEGYEGRFFGTAIVIMQKSEDGYVYYYEDDCYFPNLNARKTFDYYAKYSDLFTEEDIAVLKELNDWNKEINIELCTKSKIVDKKASGVLGINWKDFDKVTKNYAKQMGYKGNDSIYRYDIYCGSDKYGRELYYVYGVGRDVAGVGSSPPSKYQDFNFAIIFNPDKTCPVENICEVPEITVNYRETIKTLKQTVGWNQPYESSLEN